MQLKPVGLTAQDHDALGRLAYAEAGNQGASGLAAVVFAVLNRVASGRFGDSIEQVIDAPGQFEPVERSGGTWRGLAPLDQRQHVTFETILDLIVEGRLPDPTKGATYFQNPTIVAQREAEGLVSSGLTNFGGVKPVAVIKDHAFYNHVLTSGARGATAYRPTFRYRDRILRVEIQRSADGFAVARILNADTRVGSIRGLRTVTFRGRVSAP